MKKASLALSLMWAMSSACSTVYAAAPESALNDIQQLGAQNQPQRQAVTAEVEKALHLLPVCLKLTCTRACSPWPS